MSQVKKVEAKLSSLTAGKASFHSSFSGSDKSRKRFPLLVVSLHHPFKIRETNSSFKTVRNLSALHIPTTSAHSSIKFLLRPSS